MNKQIAVVVVAAVVLVTAATPASAHRQTVLDRADSDGPLDLAGASAAHKRSTETGRRYFNLELITYEAWADQTVAGGRNFLAFEFNWDRDTNIERCVVVQQREVEPGTFALEATVNQDCTYLADERVTSTPLVTRPDEHSVKIQIPRRAVTGGDPDFRWRAVSSYEEQRQSAPCASETGDGGYGKCADFTRWQRHTPN